ncbi:MAG: PepSY-associated TM helix domain-containing protein [Bacteroidota bacterium]
MTPHGRFPWRKWNNILHRDIGYLIVGLTLVYGISGIAVNHVADWNPSYSVGKSFRTITPPAPGSRAELVRAVREQLGLTEEPRNVFRPDTATIQLFYPGITYSVDLPTGHVMEESTVPRRVLFEMNQLHLNAPKGIWTYLADLYAFSLILVAVTGLFVLKGRHGLAGRGWWLTLIGAAVPLLYWVWYLGFS